MWKDGREHGKGCYTTAGMCYIGNFTDGVIDGHGVHSWVWLASCAHVPACGDNIGVLSQCLCSPVRHVLALREPARATRLVRRLQDDGSSFEAIHSMGYVVQPGEFREAQAHGYPVSPPGHFIGSPGAATYTRMLCVGFQELAQNAEDALFPRRNTCCSISRVTAWYAWRHDDVIIYRILLQARRPGKLRPWRAEMQG